ncbi:Hypothetical protein FKW44_021551, partial [Caligus rogercresseyi]
MVRSNKICFTLNSFETEEQSGYGVPQQECKVDKVRHHRRRDGSEGPSIYKVILPITGPFEGHKWESS